MTRVRFCIALLLVVACGGEKKKTDTSNIYELNREPVSVRGWITDVAGAKHGQTIEMELGRRAELFAGTSLWVENAAYASGGIQGNGAFVILDVPPEHATIGFNAPGAQDARVELKNVPGSAEVFIPDIVLERGGAKVLDPKKIIVRLPAQVAKPRTTGRTAIVAGYTVPIIESPINDFTDRREYPSVPGFRPVATVK